MHIHILGICGTFMGSLALLAKAAGHRVTGCDANVYPPMSTQLEASGIELISGFGAEQLSLAPDVFVIGNVVSRGNDLMEAILERNLPFMSGPQWLHDHILQQRWVLAVAGTHGKTTTTSMLAWILEYAGFNPGFLIGGVPGNFPESARLGGSDFFVIEADEYDTAFFDKRSKFVHYNPRTLILNNLEFDHADIFDDLKAIQRQFHHVVRLVPGHGLVIANQQAALAEVIEQGCWSSMQWMNCLPKAAVEHSGEAPATDWQVDAVNAEGSEFDVIFSGEKVGHVDWNLNGLHNVANAVSAVAAARHVGVQPALACEALGKFAGVKRRLEKLADIAGVEVYDDFAHHPTAIATTLAGLRARAPERKITVVLEPRSNTMKRGVHQQQLLASVAQADHALWYQADNLAWDLQQAVALPGAADSSLASAPQALKSSEVYTSIDEMIDVLARNCVAGECIVFMSNGGFAGIHQRFIEKLKKHYGVE